MTVCGGMLLSTVTMAQEEADGEKSIKKILFAAPPITLPWGGDVGTV